MLGNVPAGAGALMFCVSVKRSAGLPLNAVGEYEMDDPLNIVA
jgi:hypothetical protein